MSDGESVPQWVGYVRRIKPADTLNGNVVFDVPARHYRLEVADEMDEKKAIVDIPLSFNTEEVPLQVPGAPQTAPQPLPASPK